MIIAVSPVKPLALISAGCLSCSDEQSRIWDLLGDWGKAGKVSLVCTVFIVSRLIFFFFFFSPGKLSLKRVFSTSVFLSIPLLVTLYLS